MLNSNTQSQNIESIEVSTDRNNVLDKYLSKITSLDIGQVKIYLGLVYFLLVSVLTFSLFL